MLDPNGIKTISFTFILTVKDECTVSVIDDRTISDMIGKVALPAIEQDVTFTDTIGTKYTDQSYCGPRVYTLTPNHSFVTIPTTKMILYTTNVPDTGVHPITLTVSLQNFPMVTLSKAFTATIICEVQSYTLNS